MRTGANTLLCGMGQASTVRLTKDLAAWLDELSDKTGLSRGKLIRDQLERARSGGRSPSSMKLAGAVRGARDLSQRKGFSRA